MSIGFSESVSMSVSPESAFAYLGDPSTATTLDPAVISYETDTMPMRVGTQNRVRARLLGVALTMSTQVLEWEEGRRMVIETTSPARPFRATATHLFEAHPEGTLYTWSMSFAPNVPGGGLLARLASFAMRRAVRAQQARFKQIMESGK